MVGKFRKETLIFAGGAGDNLKGPPPSTWKRESPASFRPPSFTIEGSLRLHAQLNGWEEEEEEENADLAGALAIYLVWDHLIWISRKIVPTVLIA